MREDKLKKVPRNRIKIWMGVILVIAAIIIDLIGILLGLLSGGLALVIVGFFKIIAFPLTFLLLGVPPWKGFNFKKKLLTLLLSGMPLGLTGGVILTIIFTREKDRKKRKKVKEKNSKIVRFRRTREKIRMDRAA
jgi:uncharacterized membrane protein